ncbi:endo-1,4-beta-xylanase [Plakobranchus ocellatus]|uniref:Endo-1,4-beta-xylanase n=1 Tax=Plakobranchus ocellatus TaxID=259542 RepID=A0AAV4AHZ5_9GAST|nr:endo-1,4-beta-xylanase [Plakobranchus ocellatus]
MNVRGHCMFWAVDGHSPDYVKSLTAAETKAEVEKHIKYMTSITKGKLGHWDVNNELVHGHFFETQTNDPNFSKYMFRTVHSEDPQPQLFLNEYNVVAKGESTLSYLTQIQQFMKANIGLRGVGVQSHLTAFTEPDTTLMKFRLDLLAQAGLPIWVTELDISTHDEKTRADWYEKVLRLYFSHPTVEGVIFWGFWDHDMDPLKALVHGYTYDLDEAGKRFLRLTKEEWSTHVNKSLASTTTMDVRGYRGVYDLTVWYKGKPIKRGSLTLGNSDKSLTVGITGDGHEIQLPVKIDPFAAVDIDHETTSQRLRTLGQAKSSSQSDKLTCVNRKSGVSAIGDDKFVDVQCQDGEVLTGCSSLLMGMDWHRDGEQIRLVNGKPVCRAIDGYMATAGKCWFIILY